MCPFPRAPLLPRALILCFKTYVAKAFPVTQFPVLSASGWRGLDAVRRGDGLGLWSV